jgi:hypothetical protein
MLSILWMGRTITMRFMYHALYVRTMHSYDILAVYTSSNIYMCSYLVLISCCLLKLNHLSWWHPGAPEFWKGLRSPWYLKPAPIPVNEWHPGRGVPKLQILFLKIIRHDIQAIHFHTGPLNVGEHLHGGREDISQHTMCATGNEKQVFWI